MRRLICLMVCMLMLCPAAQALQLSQDDLAYYEQQLHWLTHNTQRRWVGTPDEEAAYLWLQAAFEDMGFSYGDETLADLECLSEIDGTQPSLMAVIPAQKEDAPIITVCAHYDSHSPGARDNASGVAAMLMLARVFSQGGPIPGAELRFIAFTGEEVGHLGSLSYCEEMGDDEWQRSLAVFNLDMVTVGLDEPDQVLSLDTLGMRLDGVDYVEGSVDAPACNRAAQAMLAALRDVGYEAPQEGIVRHLAASDHESFHLIGVDAVNVCFRGSEETGGGWSSKMHTPGDIAENLDEERTYQALHAVYTALVHLAMDPAYGG